MQTVWHKQRGQPREEGLIETLRAIEVGHVVLVPSWTAKSVGSHIRAARRGTEKWFSAKTVVAGARIVREA